MKTGAEERLRRCSRPSALRTLFVNSPASRRRPQQYPAKKVEVQEALPPAPPPTSTFLTH